MPFDECRFARFSQPAIDGILLPLLAHDLMKARTFYFKKWRGFWLFSFDPKQHKVRFKIDDFVDFARFHGLKSFIACGGQDLKRPLRFHGFRAF